MLLRQIARRAVARRLALGWTREELARRTGIAVDTLKRFEQTGRVSIERLLKVALALDALREFGTLFPEPEAESLAELEALAAVRQRFRGRQRGRRARVGPGADGPNRDDEVPPAGRVEGAGGARLPDATAGVTPDAVADHPARRSRREPAGATPAVGAGTEAARNDSTGDPPARRRGRGRPGTPDVAAAGAQGVDAPA